MVERSGRPAGMLRRRLRDSLAGVAWGFVLGTVIWVQLASMQVLLGWAANSGGLLLAGLIGGLIGAVGWLKLLQASVALFALVVLVVSCSNLSERLAAAWMRRDAVPPAGVDAVVPLSAIVNPDTTMGNHALDHLVFALEVIRAHPRAALVTTTASVRYRNPTGLVSSTADQERIVSLLGHDVQWLRTEVTGSTRDEAVATAAQLFPRGLRHIAVVASPMHSRRACATFEAVGFTVVCLPARMRNRGGWPSTTGPDDRLSRFGAWVYERAAMMKYRANGWVRP